MASRKSKNNGVIASLLLISLVGGAVMGAYVVTTPNARKVPADLRREDRTSAKSPDKVHALVPRMNGHDLSFEKHDVTAPDGVDRRVFVVNEYLKELHSKDIGNAKARAIGIDVRDGTAYLDFNSSFEETYGTEDEATVVNGILTTLGQFPEIERVQFEIEGKAMDSLGDLDLSTPQPVIRPGKPLPSGALAP